MNKLQFGIFFAAVGALLGTALHPGLLEIVIVTIVAIVIVGMMTSKPTPKLA